MDKIYEAKYQLGQRVWIKSPDGIPMEVKIQKMGLVNVSLDVEKIIYNRLCGITEFYEEEIIKCPK